MDTSAKKFKYSKIFKIICVLVSFVCFFAALKIAVTAIITAVYINDAYLPSSSASINEMTDWTANHSFLRAFNSDVYSVRRLVMYDYDVSQIRETLAASRQSFIDEAVKKSEQLALKKAEDEVKQAQYETTTLYYGEENDDYYEENEVTQPYSESYIIENYNDENYTYEMPVQINNSTIASIQIKAGESAEEIAADFDSHTEYWVNSYLTYNSYRGISEELNYYVCYGDNESGSVKDFKEADAYAADTYFVVKNGVPESKGISQDVVDSVYNELKDSTGFSELKLYAYLDTGKFSTVSLEEIINEGIKGKDLTYSQLYDMFGRSQGFYKNTARSFIIAALLLIVSIAFALEYFEITGKKKEDEPAKLFVYDFVPFELGLSVVGAIISGLVFVVIEAYDYIYDDQITMSVVYAILSVAVLSWICLFMFCASNARYFRSDNKAYKHFLVYWIPFGIWKALKAIWSFTVFLATKLANGVRRIFSVGIYKPKKFKRNVILLAILLAIMNISFIGVMVFAIDFNEPAIFFLFAVPLALIDGYVLYRVCRYIKNLDTLIDASSRHEDFDLELESLDSSLQTLASSMRYSNAELQAAINKAVKDERLRTELITNVSHDLKTPLTSIIVYVDLLKKCDLNDEKAQEYIKVLDEKGNKLKKLIDDLIEASKVTSGNVTVNPTNINLSELCLQATVEAQSDFEKAGLELVVKSGEKQTIVYADGTKTNRIIENLLSNARKYSAKTSRVYVSVYEENGRGVFEIKNISAQPLDITPDELTERFVRGDKSRNEEGNGLGLSIAKELCALQNGELELQIDGDLFKAKVKLPKRV